MMMPQIQGIQVAHVSTDLLIEIIGLVGPLVQRFDRDHIFSTMGLSLMFCVAGMRWSSQKQCYYTNIQRIFGTPHQKLGQLFS